MTTTHDLVRESGLPDEAVAELEPFMSALRDLAPREVPAPSPALAALMASPPGFRFWTRRRLAALGVAAAAVSSLTVTGVAAAANELPESAQRIVAEFSHRYLPFHFPEPRHGATRVEDEPLAPVPNRLEPISPDSGITILPSKPAPAVVQPSEAPPEPPKTATSSEPAQPSPQPSSSPSPSPSESGSPAPEPGPAPTEPPSVPPSAPTTTSPDAKPSTDSSPTSAPASTQPSSGPGTPAPATEPAGTT